MAASFESRYVDFGTGPVHVADFGGEGHPIVCVHGLGGSHLNWMATAPALTKWGHVTAVDLIGSGLTPVADRAATLESNRALVDLYLRSLRRPATVVSNSMGGTISILQSSQAPETVDSQILISPAVPPTVAGRPGLVVLAAFTAYVLPGIGELVVGLRRRVIDPEETLLWVMRLCAYRPDLISPDALEAHMDLARRRSKLQGVGPAFLESVRSLVATLLRRARFDQILGRLRAPTLVMAGVEDVLVDHRSIRRVQSVRPDWDYEFLDAIGHIAMLEDPDMVTKSFDSWMERMAL